MEKISLEARSKKYKFVYPRKNKRIPNYLEIPYKDHIIVEMWGVDPEIVRGELSVGSRIEEIVRDLRLNPLTRFIHQFTPHGVTGFVIVEESHLAIHTWPELEYAHLDILTCSRNTEFSRLEGLVERLFVPSYYEITELIY